MSGIAGSSLLGAPNGQIIDFERAELRRVPFQDSLYLWVSGKLPGPGFDVKLAPLLRAPGLLGHRSGSCHHPYAGQ
ncbi:MAG: hypothetical protein IPH79_05420 [Sphingomonadales bacterium]|nr:hypothetical protein [Sphingomonadales bacterium]